MNGRLGMRPLIWQNPSGNKRAIKHVDEFLDATIATPEEQADQLDRPDKLCWHLEKHTRKPDSGTAGRHAIAATPSHAGKKSQNMLGPNDSRTSGVDSTDPICNISRRITDLFTSLTLPVPAMDSGHAGLVVSKRHKTAAREVSGQA